MKQYLYNLIRKSDQLFKTDMVYMLKGSFWLTSGQVIAVITGLVTITAFANLIPPEVYGQYKYVLAIGSIVAAFSLSGLGTAITQAVSRGFEGSLKRGHNMYLFWGLGMTAIAWTGATYYFVQGNTELAISMFIIGVVQPFIGGGNLYSAFLGGRKLFKESVILYAIKAAITAAIMITALFMTHNAVILVLVYYLAQLTLNYLLFGYVLHRYKPNNATDEKTNTYGVHLSVMNALGVIAFEIDKVLVFHFLGAVELAIYSFALAMPEQIKATFKALAQLALPKFSEKKSLEDIRAGLAPKTVRLTLIFGAITLLYIVMAPFLFSIFFPVYIDSVIYSQVFALSFVAAVSILPITALQSQMKQKMLYTINIATSIIQIGLLVIGAFFYGIWGVIIARVATRYINTIISYALLKTTH